MKLLLLFIGILFATDLSAQQTIIRPKIKTDLEHAGLKGAVRSVVSEIYDIADSNGKRERIWVYSDAEIFNGSGNRLSSKTLNAKSYFNDSTLYMYDALENLVEEKNYDEHSVLVKHILTTYAAGSHKVLSETERKYWVDEDDGTTDSSITVDTYKYNELDLISEVWRSEFDEGVFSTPRLYTQNIYKDGGSIRHQYEYRSAQHPQDADSAYQRLNTQGLIVEGHNAQTSFEYAYDGQGRFLTATYRWGTMPRKFTRHKYSYDKWGNKTATEITDENGKPSGDQVSSRYSSIDKKGNWLEVSSFKNGKWVYFCRRVIKYH